MTPGYSRNGRSRISLPGTGLEVSPLCLGGVKIGGDLSQAESFGLLDAFVALGGNFIDTAHVYSDWIAGNEKNASEKTIGRWIRDRSPKDIIVASKIGHWTFDRPFIPQLDPKNLEQEILECRDNLGIAVLDLVYLHRDDPERDVEDILACMEHFKRRGLIRNYAASNWTVGRLRTAMDVARRRGWAGFVANQCEWSLAIRNAGSAAADLVQMDAETLAFHSETNLPMISYSSQAQGYFDKVMNGASLSEDVVKAYDNPANRALAKRLADTSTELGTTPTVLALAVLTRASFPSIPVVGSHTPRQLESSFGALDLRLDGELLAELARPVPAARETLP